MGAEHFIGGRWVPARAVLPVIDPAREETFAHIGRGTAADVDAAVEAATRALGSSAWRSGGPVARERWLHRLADLIERDADVLAAMETRDNGMLLGMARHMNVPASVDVLRYFAGWPTKLAGETPEVSSPLVLGPHWGMTRREPIGVIGAIIPWNVPLMMAVWKLAPALAAGCTIVLKPSEDASMSALMLAELIEEAGFPAGVVNVVTGTGEEAGAALARHPGIAKLSFTGSTETGRAVGLAAAGSIRPVTLELGGKSPTIIFADADLDRAVPAAANSIFMNAGQVCVAGSRLYVERSIIGELCERLQAFAGGIVVGPGNDPASGMGPLINARQRERVRSFVEGARARGCEVHEAPLERELGFFQAPTIIHGAAHDDPITQDEIFGPVLSVYPFDEEDEVVGLANGTAYGLAAFVWTRDMGRALRLAERLRCGKVCLNSGGFPYPALPEGGVGGSGFGRDLGRAAVEQCLVTKTILIGTAA